jgi:TolB-like protein/Flp pilus assembly protein TadD
MTHDVFISYATKDKPIADAVCTAVEAGGFRCWIAPRDVLAGMPYGEAIIDAIQGSRVMVVVFSANANASAHIPNEVERALTNGVKIIPLRIENVLPAKSLDYFLGPLHWLDALTAPLEPHLQKLTEAIAQTLPERAPVEPPIVATKAAPSTEHRPWWRAKAAMAVAVLTLLAVLAGAGWAYRSRISRGEAIDSLAVLPFVNGSGDPNKEYLSDGITESLINSLSQLPNLAVKSRDSSFHYKGKDPDPEAVGRDLGVRAVFKGRVSQAGDNLDISAELIDARNDDHIWGEQYSRKASEIFALQTDISKEITSALRTRLTGEDEKRMAKSYTANPEAYQDYLKGRYWWNKKTEEGDNKGIEYFQQAIEKDPTYALAYSGLSDSYSSLAEQGDAPPQETYPKAKEAALKSLEIDDTLGEAHTSLGYIKADYDWDWSGAEKEYQRAIQLNPGYAIAHNRYGYALLKMGRFQEAIAETKQALELDPLSLPINRDLGDAFYFARQYDQAIEQLRKTEELEPNYAQPQRDLVLAYAQKSMYKEAIAEGDKRLAVAPDDRIALAYLGYAYAKAGRRVEAKKVLDQLNDLSKRQYVPARRRTIIYAGLGEKDRAFEWMEKAYDDRELGAGVGSIKVDPAYDPLRSDPRFADLLRKMNLTP